MKRIRAYLRSGLPPLPDRRRRLAASVAAGALLAVSVLPGFAQSFNPFNTATTSVGEQQMLLEADEMVYDFDSETVTANGHVQIYYGAAFVDADRVIYQKKSGRLVATGGVRMLEPDGNIITADTLDITDDFRDGFLSSLNVITTDRAHLSAQTAERRNGNITVFRKATYTACQPCLSHPERPPLWQIKAARIIHNQSEHTIYYQDASLEFLGIPIAYVPYFSHPDPTVRRKTGFLTPSVMHTKAIGFGVTTPYFWNLAPNYDVTFSPTYLTRQGLLMEGEWRHRLMNGSYSIRVAGIFQQDKDAFDGTGDDGEKKSGFRDFRGSFRTKGDFAINSRWGYGWDLYGNTDRTFNRDYDIAGATGKDLTSTLYLTGLSERNFFDLRGYYFRVQRENTVEEIPGPDYVHDDQAEQAIVHPVLDHNYIVGTPVLGGELRFDSNFTSLSRAESDIRHPPAPFDPYYAGIAGNFTRATTRASWQRRFVAFGGQLVTPLAYAQGDLNFVAFDPEDAGLESNEVVPRGMAAVGLQYEWPFLATIGSSVHTFGPKAQLIVRPDEQHVGDVSNEDSQSLVFDDTSLFSLDKFSGYDRVEGGTRANVGLVYQGLLGNGVSVDALVGQSFQLAGANSFAMQDMTLTGVGSGLETDVSDYVGRLTLNTGTGLSFTARGRFDDEDLSLNRGEFNAIGAYGDSVGGLGYAFIRQSPSAGIFEDRQEINAAAKVEVVDNWSVLGSLVYDLERTSTVSQSVGLAYADDCFELSAVYKETPASYSDLVTDREFFVRFNLRTLGDDRLGSQLENDLD